MKKFITGSMLVAGLLIAPVILSDSHSQSSVEASTVTALNATGMVATQKDPLTVRQSASTSAKVLGTVAKGTTVTITGEVSGWYRIKYKNDTGWVSKTYISNVKKVTTDSNNTQTIKFTDYKATGYVNTQKDPLTVRQSASTSASSLGTVAKGADVIITGKAKDWYRIQYKNGTGYVSAVYIVENVAEPINKTTTAQKDSKTQTFESALTSSPKSWKYKWDFKSQTVTVPLNKVQSYSGKEIYRGFGSVGMKIQYKVSTSKLEITSVAESNTTFFPVSVESKNDGKIHVKNATVGKIASASVNYRGSLFFQGAPLFNEQLRTEVYVKLLSIDKTKKTAKVQIIGHLYHTDK